MIADYLRDGFGPRRSPTTVLTVAQVRAIFVSTKEAKVLAIEYGVDVSQIRRIWDRSRWGQFTSDLERPRTRSLDCSVFDSEAPASESNAVDQAETPSLDRPSFDSVDVLQKSNRGSLTWRLAPSERIAIAEIRRPREATRLVPVATYALYRRLLTEARTRGATVEFEGGERFQRWLGVRIREEARQASA